MFRTPIGVALASSLALGWACGPGGRSAPPAPPIDPCEAGDLGACVAAAARTCRPDAAWRIELTDLPALEVARSGALHLAQHGGSLHAVDATRIAACFADCPGGGGERVCFPLELPVRLAWERPAGCAIERADAPPWRGHPSRLEREGCGDATLRIVPALAPVRDALVRAGVIGGDAMAGAAGLVVAAGPADAPAIEIRAVAAAACAGFALPAGFRRALGPDDVAALAGIAAAPRADAEQRSRALLEGGVLAARAAAKREVLDWVAAHHAERCRADGFDPADRAALETCATRMPETEPRYASALAGALLAERVRHRTELDAITRDALIGPICRAYAARAPM